MRTGLGAAGGFAVSMAVLAAISIVMIPVMITAAGPDGWSAIAVGQGVGTITAVAIAYGWNFSGPVTIARGDQRERWTEYAEAWRGRLLLAGPLLLVSSLVAALVSPHGVWLAVLGNVTTSVIGLTASWYFVGTQQPWHLLGLETLPRVVGTAAAIGLMLGGGSAALGLCAQAAGVLVAAGVCTRHVMRGAPRDLVLRPFGELLRVHRDGVTSTLLSAVYLVLPLVLISFFVTPTALAAFAVLDRVQKQVYVASSPLTKALQGWVPTGDEDGLLGRAGRALLVGAGIASTMTVGFLLLGHWFVGLLGAGSVEVPFVATALVAALIGLAFFDTVVSQAVLAPLGRIRAVAAITLWGSVAGLVLVALAAWQEGVVGGIVAMVTGIAARVVAQLIVVRRAWRAEAARTRP